ncbi:MAG TPA: hypothetical protein VK961_25045 [Chthoniobacter sp.]|nr:hypothetical protein [Chthoniobacter sp.]
MKTARFSEVVKQCGRPESYLVLVDPAKDKTLKASVKAHRVLTVSQATVGAKADYGEVGFEEGGTRQYLIFPKSLRHFAGRRIVGIKYDLLSLKELPASQRAAAPKPPPPKKKAPRKIEPAHETHAGKVIPFKAAQDEGAKEEEHPKETTDEPSMKEMKRMAKQAMHALKAGKQVAAFELLKKMAQE